MLTLLRDTVESNMYPVSMLMLDGVFFLLCALHPSKQGLWLSTVAYFYVLRSRRCLYEWWHVCGSSCGSVFFFAIFRPQPSMWLWPAVVLGGVLAIVLALHKHSFQDRLSAALKTIGYLAVEAETARESERQRIADDFHDGPLQSFISFQMRLEIIRKLLERDRDAAMRELMQLQDLGRAQVTELRSFVRGMQPADVSPSNLQSAIREAVEHFERDSGISATLICGDLSVLEEGAASGVSADRARSVEQCSEALEGIGGVDRDRSQRSGVDLIVEDDGSGFPFSGAYSLDELEILRLGPEEYQAPSPNFGGDLTITFASAAGFRGSRPHSGMRFVFAAVPGLADRVFAIRGFHSARTGRPPGKVTYEWNVHPSPVIARGSDWDRVDALNPSVIRDANGSLLNFYSGYDGKTWHTGHRCLRRTAFRGRRKGTVLSPGSLDMGRRLYRRERIVSLSAPPVSLIGIRRLGCLGSDSCVGFEETRTTRTGSTGRGEVGMSAASPIPTSSRSATTSICTFWVRIVRAGSGWAWRVRKTASRGQKYRGNPILELGRARHVR